MFCMYCLIKSKKKVSFDFFLLNVLTFKYVFDLRSFPHPYITVLENRPDCWPALLQEIDDFLQLATDKYENS